MMSADCLHFEETIGVYEDGPSLASRCKTPRAPVKHFDDSASCPLNLGTPQLVLGWAASARAVSVRGPVSHRAGEGSAVALREFRREERALSYRAVGASRRAVVDETR